MCFCGERRFGVRVRGSLGTSLSEKDVFGGHSVFLHSGERDHIVVLLTLKAKWFVTLT